MATVSRSSDSVKQLRPALVAGCWLTPPAGDRRRPGVLLIDHVPYLVTALGWPADQGGPGLLGYRLVKHDGSIYDVDCRTAWGEWSCDCPDGTYCPERPGGCKHIAALRDAEEIRQAEGGAA